MGLLRKPGLRWGEALTSSSLALTHSTASGWGFMRTHSVLVLHDNEVTVTEAEINALIKAAGVNVEPLCPGLFAKALANVNTGGVIRKVGPPARLLPQQREEFQNSADPMGFGLFDFCNMFNKKLNSEKKSPVDRKDSKTMSINLAICIFTVSNWSLSKFLK